MHITHIRKLRPNNGIYDDCFSYYYSDDYGTRNRYIWVWSMVVK